MNQRQFLIIAHRGASADAPENTMAAFKLALAQRADMIELDVRRSSDGALVIMHDPTTEHVEQEARAVEALSLAELRQIALPDSQRIPTLEEALAWAADEAMPLNIEIKIDGVEAGVVELVRRYGHAEKTLVSSFRSEVLRKIAALAPEIAIGALTDPEVGPGENAYGGDDPIPLLRDLGAVAWHPNYRQISGAEQLRAVRAAGYRVYPWTVDEAADVATLLSWGVDGIITNRPGALAATRDSQAI